MTQTQHTATPYEAHYDSSKDRWEIGNFKTYNPIAFVPDPHRIGKLDPCQEEIDAAFIVKSCNSFDDMLAFIEKVGEWDFCNHGGYDSKLTAQDEAFALLKKVREV